MNRKNNTNATNATNNTNANAREENATMNNNTAAANTAANKRAAYDVRLALYNAHCAFGRMVDAWKQGKDCAATDTAMLRKGYASIGIDTAAATDTAMIATLLFYRAASIRVKEGNTFVNVVGMASFRKALEASATVNTLATVKHESKAPKAPKEKKASVASIRKASKEAAEAGIDTAIISALLTAAAAKDTAAVAAIMAKIAA